MTYQMEPSGDPTLCARDLRAAALYLSQARDRQALQRAMSAHLRVWRTLSRMAGDEMSEDLQQRVAEGAAYVHRTCPANRRVAPSDHHIEYLIALDTKIARHLEGQ